jgi:hypothetical protein
MTDARQVHLETYIDPLIANLLVHKSDAALGKMPAGAIRRDLLEAAENAAAKACRDPAVWEDGRFDRWLDSASKAIGALARFQSPPVELTGDGRGPEGFESQHRGAAAFDRPMVLLDDVCRFAVISGLISEPG